MIRKLQPILHTSLVYIDDVLLFNNTLDKYLNLFNQFHGLVKQYRVMLSLKKMTIFRDEIDFLEMNFSYGSFTPGLHTCQELLKFLDTNF